MEKKYKLWLSYNSPRYDESHGLVFVCSSLVSPDSIDRSWALSFLCRDEPFVVFHCSRYRDVVLEFFILDRDIERSVAEQINTTNNFVHFIKCAKYLMVSLRVEYPRGLVSLKILNDKMIFLFILRYSMNLSLVFPETIDKFIDSINSYIKKRFNLKQILGIDILTRD